LTFFLLNRHYFIEPNLNLTNTPQHRIGLTFQPSKGSPMFDNHPRSRYSKENGFFVWTHLDRKERAI
jgi:hypothetical protein